MVHLRTPGNRFDEECLLLSLRLVVTWRAPSRPGGLRGSCPPASAWRGIRTLIARDQAMETWLREQVVPAAQALKADPGRAVSANLAREQLATTTPMKAAKPECRAPCLAPER
ncbi:hypothetical protein GCM10011394_20370 [Luteimonas terricola]|uniref:Uncharacterized protein n=1 Tax=Luteimonas terricola TaxID=645597 RepID=A0ABQ2EGF2_9GAMM|nr:hypothetical protein GCM10011394_20370 [Luteimonas terricola]